MKMPHRIAEFYNMILVYIGSSITAFAWFWGVLGSNQPQITSLCGIGGFCLAAYSFCKNRREINGRRRRNK